MNVTIVQQTETETVPPPVTAVESHTTMMEEANTTTIISEMKQQTMAFEMGTTIANESSTVIPEMTTVHGEGATAQNATEFVSTLHPAEIMQSTVTGGVEQNATVHMIQPTTKEPGADQSTVTDPSYKLIACFQKCIDHYGCKAV